jgi:glyoxylase-like metal-dependent hydrolase (beta-lactamase superfamily II)
VPAWICVRCGVQYPDAAAPPVSCPVCEDEREAVPVDGQHWTHMAELGSDHRTEIRAEEPGLTGIGVTPEFGIGQRALLVRTAAGNVLWDCVPLLDEPARRAIDELGGLSAICLSHPHFYAAHLEFAAAFDAPVFLPRADEQWIPRNSPRIELFDDEIEPVPGLTVARIGGHFDGAAVLHWPAGAEAAVPC